MEKFISNSYKKTAKIAQKLAKSCKIGDVLLLFGDLGAGKTAFVKGFAKEFGKAQVTSPTFTIINTYDGKIPIYHLIYTELQVKVNLKKLGLVNIFMAMAFALLSGHRLLLGFCKKML